MGQISLLCSIYDIVLLLSMVKACCYVMIVDLNCNSISTKIVLIVSISFEELTGKKLLILKQKMMNIKNYILLWYWK